MEAVPKLPMLSLELKVSPENTHFGPKLKQYISDTYGEDPESYSNEIHQLEGLRSAAVRPTLDLAGLKALIRYFSQLKAMKSRFPMGKGQAAAVTFTWKDIYANMSCALEDVKFEMACILYNLAVMFTNLASLEPRNTPDSLKDACTYLQKASWVFQRTREQFPQPSGVDMSQEMLRLFQEICFAQAQECILEKSIQDTKKPSVIGAVATQVLNFYRNSLALLGPSSGQDNVHEIVATKKYNHWYRYLSFKISYIGCIVSLYQGMHAEEQQKMGERVAFYQQAVDRLAEATKLAKYIEPTDVTQEALTFTNDVVEGKRKAAKNENEFIYHEEVPDKDLLQDMKPVCLIKALPVDFGETDPSAGIDVFHRLVPLGVHEASSVYSEEKAKLLRHVVSLAEEKNTELMEFMSSLQIDQLDILTSDQRIPQEIVDRCAAMNAKTDIIQLLVDSMNSLAEIISDVEHSLSDIKSFIQEEGVKEKEYQKVMGPRPPSIVQTELLREYNKYHEAHLRTNESNQVLHKAMTLHIANLRLLALPLDELQSKIPSIDNVEGLDRAAMAEMARVVRKARDMQTQRAALVDQLRQAVVDDDVTQQVMARCTDPLNEIFKTEMEKHTPKVKIIEQNLAAQENIINRLTSIYASYGESRRLLADVIRKREGLINALITSYDTHEELLRKSQKGLDFYKRLSHNVSQLLSRLRSTCQVQEEERAQLLAKQTVKVSNAPSVVPAPTKRTDNEITPVPASVNSTPKLRDYLPYMKNRGISRSITPVQPESVMSDSYYPETVYPTSVRPTPVGSEATSDPVQIKYQDGYIATPNPNPTSYNEYGQYSNVEHSPYPVQAGYYPTNDKSLAYEQPELKPNLDHVSANYGYNPAPYTASVANPHYNPYCGNTQENPTVEPPTPQYAVGNVGHVTTPSQYVYNDPYAASMGSNISNPYTPIPEALSAISTYHSQADLSGSFAQMQVSAAIPEQKYEAPANSTGVSFASDYTQNYYMQYTPASTPNSPYSSGQGVACVPVSQVPSDYNSVNYQYGNLDVTLGQTYSQQQIVSPSASGTIEPPIASNYDASNVYNNSSVYTAVDSGTTLSSMPSAANQMDSYSGYNVYSDPERIVSSVALTNMDSMDKPIKSHVTGEALAVDASAYQFYQPYEASAATSTTDYPNSELSTQSYPFTETSNPGQTQGFQNHPGYTFNNASGCYDYNYGSQNSYTSYVSVNRPEVDPQNVNEQGWPQPGVYTRAGTYGTVQSPSENQQVPQMNEPTTDPAYYNSPYGYQTLNQTVPDIASLQLETTNYTSGSNHSTYMQSGQAPDTSVTYSSSNNQVSTTKENQPELPNFAPNEPQNHQNTSTLEQLPQTLPTQETNIQNVSEEQTVPDVPKLLEKGPAKTTLSAFDLLSDIDFSVEQTPLMPEIKVPQVSESAIKKFPPAKAELARVAPKVEDKVERPAKNDLFSDPSLVNKFTQEVKNLQKLVDSFTCKSAGGLTVLDNKWKMLQDLQAKENMCRTKTIAMQYSDGNIVTDVAPYDDSRLTLKSNPDIYFNASYYKQLAPWCIPLVISKSPTEKDHALFWRAILENKISCIVCLLTEIEMQGEAYWPTAKGQTLECDGLRVTLEEVACSVHWTERRLTLARGNTIHSLVHYQISVFPAKIACSPLVLLADKILSVTYDNKLSNQLCCAWIHCSHGAGRSAVISLLLMAMCQVRAGQLDLCDMLETACANLYKHRANVLEDTKYLADAYRTTLFYVHGVLCSGTALFNGETVAGPSGASVPPPTPTPTPASSSPHTPSLAPSAERDSRTNKFSRESFEEMKQSPGLKSGDMKDPLNFLDPLWSLKKK